MHEQRMGPSDVARRWGVSRSTVLSLIEEAKLPALAVRKTAARTTYRIKLVDVEAYEASNTTGSADAAPVLEEVGVS